MKPINKNIVYVVICVQLYKIMHQIAKDLILLETIVILLGPITYQISAEFTWVNIILIF